MRISRLDGKAKDTRGKGHLQRIRVDDGRQVAPVLAAVVAGIDFAAFRAQEHDLWVVRVELQRPHGPSFREIHPLPVIATVLTPIHPALRADKHRLAVLRVDGNGPHLWRGGHAIGELFPVRSAGALAIEAMGFGTDIDIRFVCHTVSLLSEMALRRSHWCLQLYHARPPLTAPSRSFCTPATAQARSVRTKTPYTRPASVQGFEPDHAVTYQPVSVRDLDFYS